MKVKSSQVYSKNNQNIVSNQIKSSPSTSSGRKSCQAIYRLPGAESVHVYSLNLWGPPNGFASTCVYDSTKRVKWSALDLWSVASRVSKHTVPVPVVQERHSKEGVITDHSSDFGSITHRQRLRQRVRSHLKTTTCQGECESVRWNLNQDFASDVTGTTTCTVQVKWRETESGRSRGEPLARDSC